MSEGLVLQRAVQSRKARRAFSARAVARRAAACLSFALLSSQAAAEPAACTLQPGGTRTVARVVDAETLTLDDGSELRLIGALPPRAHDAGATAGAWPIETDTVRLLTSLVLGRTVKLAYGQRRTDRYGRHLAHVFLGNGNRETDTWVQGELLRRGAARAYGIPGNFECARELLAHERIARDQKLGLWSIDLYRPKPSRLTGQLMSRRSRYEIVEGVVATVSQTKYATYLNFSADWKTDFTARITKDVLSAHPQFAQSLAGIKDKRVAVRGWIERRNGPMIDIRDPSQLEITDPANNAPALSLRPAPRPTENANAPAASEPAPHDADGDGIPAAGMDDDSGTAKRPAEPDTVQPGAVDL